MRFCIMICSNLPDQGVECACFYKNGPYGLIYLIASNQGMALFERIRRCGLVEGSVTEGSRV